MNVQTILAGEIILYVEIVLGLVALMSAIFIAFNMAALKNYKETVESQEKRIETLERDNGVLSTRIELLEGQERGYEFAIRMLVNEIAMSSVCENAEFCERRRPPERVIANFKESIQDVHDQADKLGF